MFEPHSIEPGRSGLIKIIVVDIDGSEGFGRFDLSSYMLPAGDGFVKIAGIAPVGAAVAVIKGDLQIVIPAAGVRSDLF